MIKVLSIFGTRPEAVKMLPLIKELEKYPGIFQSIVCVTAQHRQMLDRVLELFKVKPDFDLNIMRENQNLWTLTSDILLKTKEVTEKVKPDIVLVHGDTTTSTAAALSAFYAKIPIGHVEAGLRTFDKYYPFPEEINRVITDNLSSYHFAPSDRACENLKNAGISSKHIYNTGNTVIDALLYTAKNFNAPIDGLNLNPGLKTIILTAHRRENFGEPLKNICNAVQELVKRNKDIEFVYPVHPNPNVKKPVYEMLQGFERIHLIEPLEYAQFCTLMKRSYLILTDSGGIQEEAPALGKPVLVLRNETERIEALEYGTVKLIGHNTEKIIFETENLLNNQFEYKKMSEAKNPYGNGTASENIVKILRELI